MIINSCSFIQIAMKHQIETFNCKWSINSIELFACWIDSMQMQKPTPKWDFIVPHSLIESVSSESQWQLHSCFLCKFTNTKIPLQRCNWIEWWIWTDFGVANICFSTWMITLLLYFVLTRCSTFRIHAFYSFYFSL